MRHPGRGGQMTADRRSGRRRHRSSPARRRRRPPRPARRAAAGTRCRRRSSSNPVDHPLLHSRIPGRRAAQLAGDREHRAGSRPGPQHRRPAGQVAQHRHRHHPLSACDQIPADHARTQPLGLGPHPVGQRGGLGGRRVGRGAEADDECGGAGAPIASMSAAFCAIALRPTSCGVDQSSRKCRPSTSMSVDTTVRPSAQPHHRGVVAGPQLGGAGLTAPGDQPVDHGKLSKLTQRGLVAAHSLGV